MSGVSHMFILIGSEQTLGQEVFAKLDFKEVECTVSDFGYILLGNYVKVSQGDFFHAIVLAKRVNSILD
jgi:hypothetical protein